MAPIRVGLIGLSAIGISEPSVGNWGVLAHLKPLLQSPHYELTAVCNSSVESAQKSIDFHKLPKTVKAYGNPDDLASDPNVDLVVVSVNVGKHYQLTKPALLKKKDVLVEWPLAASLEESQELAQLAKQQGVRTALGLQLRTDPLIWKVKEIIASGALGRITSSTASGCSSVIPADVWLHEASYYMDFKSGGNEFYIYFGHFLDAFTSVLGGFETVQSLLKTQETTTATVSVRTGQQVETALPKTSPDHILVQGELASGAVASISFRKAKKPVDALGLRWLITGTKGELEITYPEDHFQFGPADRAIRFRSGKEGEVEVVNWHVEEPAYISDVAYPGTNTARLYEAFAEGGEQLSDFESGLKHHELLNQIAKQANYL